MVYAHASHWADDTRWVWSAGGRTPQVVGAGLRGGAWPALTAAMRAARGGLWLTVRSFGARSP